MPPRRFDQIEKNEKVFLKKQDIIIKKAEKTVKRIEALANDLEQLADYSKNAKLNYFLFYREEILAYRKKIMEKSLEAIQEQQYKKQKDIFSPIK